VNANVILAAKKNKIVIIVVAIIVHVKTVNVKNNYVNISFEKIYLF